MKESNSMKGKIGLEIHTYLISKEKLFCRCKASREKGLKPNLYICPICTGQPGAKPMLPNKSAVEKAVLIGLMLGCKINERVIWQRKHYNWPDLPKGYQNTLSGPYAFPVGVDGEFQKIRIREMHLEEDPASWEPSTGHVDYNRSGVPLVEIVTEPDFTTAEEVEKWLKTLLHNLEYLKAVQSDAGIKADVNVNIHSKTERVEIKNVNSIENIGAAINYELERQMKEGSTRETRRFDEGKGITIRMRGKEEAEDYRFISDPDLKDIVLDKKFIESLKNRLPESPENKVKKFVSKYRMEKKDAEVLAQHVDIADFFERVAQKIEPRFAARWVAVELLRHLNYNKTTLDNLDIKVEHFVELLQFVKEGKITELQGKEILNKFYPKSFSLKEKAVQEKIGDSGEIERVAKEVIESNKDLVFRYKAGDVKVLNFLIGQVMAKTQKRADFKITREVLERFLEHK